MRLLPLLILATASASCRYAGPYVQEQEPIQVKLTATPSTAVYARSGRAGVYALKRFEGTARETIRAARHWRLEPRNLRSPRSVVQPVSLRTVELRRRPDGGAELVHGEGVSQLEFVTGSFDGWARGEDVVLKLTEASWLNWVRASQDAWLDAFEVHRARIASRLRSDQSLGDPYVADVVVTEQPLLRANQEELLIFFESLEIEGGIDVLIRRRDKRYGWWAYELRPGARRALRAVGRATMVVAVLSLEFAARCARCR